MNEPSNIGLSEEAHSILEQWKEDEHFNEQRDAYKFAVAYALSKNVTPPEIKRKNMYGVSTIDPDKTLAIATRLLSHISDDESVYKYIERLASWGVCELDKQIQKSGELDLSAILEGDD